MMPRACLVLKSDFQGPFCGHSAIAIFSAPAEARMEGWGCQWDPVVLILFSHSREAHLTIFCFAFLMLQRGQSQHAVS